MLRGRGGLRAALSALLALFVVLPVFCTESASVADVDDAAYKPMSEAMKLDQMRGFFQQPKMDGVGDTKNLLPTWFKSWRVDLHNQIDGLLLELRLRREAVGARSPPRAGRGSQPSPSVEIDDGLGFRIAIVGDSTMRMQARGLGWLLAARTALDCVDVVAGVTNALDLRCRKAEGQDTGGKTPSAENPVVISLVYVKEINSCVSHEVNADFVYFGCGLRLLQLIPDRVHSKVALDAWIHYEKALEEAAVLYGSPGGHGREGLERSRVPVGEVFMTSHSFDESKLEGDYKTRVRNYQERNATLLEICRDTVNDLIPTVDGKNRGEYKPEDICTRGCFDDAGVEDLNRRANTVMSRHGIPTVPGYDITYGQSWATPRQDGRHYPALIPVELSAFLSEFISALRRERWEANAAAAPGGGAGSDGGGIPSPSRSGKTYTIHLTFSSKTLFLVLCSVASALAALLALCSLVASRKRLRAPL